MKRAPTDLQRAALLEPAERRVEMAARRPVVVRAARVATMRPLAAEASSATLRLGHGQVMHSPSQQYSREVASALQLPVAWHSLPSQSAVPCDAVSADLLECMPQMRFTVRVVYRGRDVELIRHFHLPVRVRGCLRTLAVCRRAFSEFGDARAFVSYASFWA